MTLEATFLTAGRLQTHLLHFLLDSGHGAHMLDIELLSRVLELIDSTFHLLKIRVDLSPVLIIYVHDFNQTFLKHKSLLL